MSIIDGCVYCHKHRRFACFLKYARSWVVQTKEYAISICCFSVKYTILRLGCCHFQQYLDYIVTVSFIGGENQSTRRKPLTCHKSLTNFITVCCIAYRSQTLEKAKTGRFEIKILGSCGATCLTTDCCFSEPQLFRSKTKLVTCNLAQSEHHLYSCI